MFSVYFSLCHEVVVVVVLCVYRRVVLAPRITSKVLFFYTPWLWTLVMREWPKLDLNPTLLSYGATLPAISQSPCSRKRLIFCSLTSLIEARWHLLAKKPRFFFSPLGGNWNWTRNLSVSGQPRLPPQHHQKLQLPWDDSLHELCKKSFQTECEENRNSCSLEKNW